MRCRVLVSTANLGAIALVILVIGTSGAINAGPGVGVNLGRIDIDDPLVRGRSYVLPTIGVSNPGDAAGNYSVGVSYRHEQPELQPDAGWFDFRPPSFTLDPGEGRGVEIRLNLPAGARPGDYFALIEAQQLTEGETVRLGVAAATMLTFSVQPSSWFDAQRERLNRWLTDNEPWTFVVPSLLAVTVLLYVLSRHLQINVSRRQ